MVSRRQIAKGVSLAVVVAVFVYLLIPPPETLDETQPEGTAGASVRDRPNATHLIRFSPGQSYLPGATPFGIGEPLEGLTRVIRDFERRFPDTHIEVVNSPAVREYLVTQLSSGAAPDIVNVNVEDVWVDTQKGWYVPLDAFFEAPNPFVTERGDTNAPGARQWWDMFRYQAISRGKAAPDGRNYCLTLDMVETGIFYNKTIFGTLGLEPPRTWDELIAVCRRLRDDGKIPLLMHISAFVDWAHDLFFDQLYYGILPGIDLKQDATREAYLQGYLDPEELAYLFGKGFFTERDPRYRELWRIMRDLKQYTNRNMETSDLTREFVTQRGAMLWTGSWMTYRLAADAGLGFDWGVFYLPPFTTNTTPYASGVDMCVIGGSASQFEVTNAALRDTPPDQPIEARMAQSQRLKRVMAFLQFLCLPEQAERVVNEYPCFLPNIVGVDPLPQLDAFEHILRRRYTTTKWAYSFDLRFSDILQRMLALYLTGGSDEKEFLHWQVGNIRAATKNLVERKHIDPHAFDARWRELAPRRAKMRGIPEAPPTPGTRQIPPPGPAS